MNLIRFVWQHPLNAKARWSALWRVVRWQIASRLMAGPIALPFVEGTKLFATRGMTGATGNWYCGLHEVSEMAFVLHLLRPGEHFVDVGANIGSYTVLAAGAVQARVTAVEPVPVTFSHLNRNVTLNDLSGRVRCVQVGLSDEAGTARFSSGLDTVNHVLAADEVLPALDVPVMRLDDLLGTDIPTLIKIDVEGFELPVIGGSQMVLSQAQLLAVLMETNGSGSRYGVSDDALMDAMGSHGFLPYRYDPFARKLVSASGSCHNTIFVRNRAEAEARVSASRRYALVNGAV